MALLKDTTVAGSLSVTNDLIASAMQTGIVNLPTSSGGSTYGVGTDGQVVKSNGTTVYWGTDDSGLELGETSTTAYRGDRGKEAYDHATFGQNVFYVEGGSSDTAGAWTGTITGLTAYFNGLTILYRPTVAGVSSGTSINLNGLGAIPCYYTGVTALTTHYVVGSIILFTYYDGAWRRADYNTNTTYSTLTVANITAGTATSARTITAANLRNGLTGIFTKGDNVGGVKLWTTEVNVLPTVTSSDNGKILMVVDGAWAAASIPSATGQSF